MEGSVRDYGCGCHGKVPAATEAVIVAQAEAVAAAVAEDGDATSSWRKAQSWEAEACRWWRGIGSPWWAYRDMMSWFGEIMGPLTAIAFAGTTRMWSNEQQKTRSAE